MALKERSVDKVPAALSILMIAVLWFLPTGFEDRLLYQSSEKTSAEVLSVNNDMIMQNGIVKVGEQGATVKFKKGKFAGRTSDAFNHLTGSLGRDKTFKPGDTARVVIDYSGDNILAVNLIDHDRIPAEIIIFIVFSFLLLIVAGKTGFRALLSFLLSILAIWKLLVPGLLKGHSPIILGMAIISTLTVLIISSVFGFSLRSLSAIGGSLLGISATLILALYTTNSFILTGTVMEQSESLIYAGFQDLKLTPIFITTVFIGASGAVMDLSVDITAAVAEVVRKKPAIKWPEAFKSALNVGRAALGTITTTLLFAYSGGYLVLMMVFMAQGTPLQNILNYRQVAAEILHTMVGSIGLVTVAPFTAFLAAILLTSTRGKEELKEIAIEEELKAAREEISAIAG